MLFSQASRTSFDVLFIPFCVESFDVTVYPDVDAAAYKWPEATENTAEPYPLSIVNDAIEKYDNKELSIDYRAGYLYGVLLCVRIWLKINAKES